MVTYIYIALFTLRDPKAPFQTAHINKCWATLRMMKQPVTQLACCLLSSRTLKMLHKT